MMLMIGGIIIIPICKDANHNEKTNYENKSIAKKEQH